MMLDFCFVDGGKYRILCFIAYCLMEEEHKGLCFVCFCIKIGNSKPEYYHEASSI